MNFLLRRFYDKIYSHRWLFAGRPCALPFWICLWSPANTIFNWGYVERCWKRNRQEGTVPILLLQENDKQLWNMTKDSKKWTANTINNNKNIDNIANNYVNNSNYWGTKPAEKSKTSEELKGEIKKYLNWESKDRWRIPVGLEQWFIIRMSKDRNRRVEILHKQKSLCEMRTVVQYLPGN